MHQQVFGGIYLLDRQLEGLTNLGSFFRLKIPQKLGELFLRGHDLQPLTLALRNGLRHLLFSV